MGETGDCGPLLFGNVEPRACTAVVLIGDGVGPGVIVVKFVGLADVSSVFDYRVYVSSVRNGLKEPLTAGAPDVCRFRGRKIYL
jgi:hypothetical protein